MQDFFREFIGRWLAPGEATNETEISPLWQRGPERAGRGALILLLERSQESVENFLDTAQGKLTRFDPGVFVTTASDLRPFHRRGLIVERMPSLAEISSRDMRVQWSPYLNRRIALLRAKWRPRW
ncbi:MAG: hypothetical protein AAFR01_11590, partial [Pseudomonadota bacterium]